MNLVIAFIFVFSGCIIYIYLLGKNKKKKSITSIQKCSNILFCSSNRNSYKSARNVFKILKNAQIEINFLGGNHE